MRLVTPQTSKEGKLVNQVLLSEDVYYPGKSEKSEFYVSVLLNRKTAKNMMTKMRTHWSQRDPQMEPK